MLDDSPSLGGALLGGRVGGRVGGRLDPARLVARDLERRLTRSSSSRSLCSCSLISCSVIGYLRTHFKNMREVAAALSGAWQMLAKFCWGYADA